MIGLVMMLAAVELRTPIARGPKASVSAVARAARQCGARDVRYKAIDSDRASLSIGKRNSFRSVDCTLMWLKRHDSKLGLQPLFTGNRAPS